MSRDFNQALAQVLEVELAQHHGEKVGFCLLVFGFDAPGIANYISNAERKSMIEALRETADRLEKGECNQ